MGNENLKHYLVVRLRANEGSYWVMDVELHQRRLGDIETVRSDAQFLEEGRPKYKVWDEDLTVEVHAQANGEDGNIYAFKKASFTAENATNGALATRLAKAMETLMRKTLNKWNEANPGPGGKTVGHQSSAKNADFAGHLIEVMVKRWKIPTNRVTVTVKGDDRREFGLSAARHRAWRTHRDWMARNDAARAEDKKEDEVKEVSDA